MAPPEASVPISHPVPDSGTPTPVWAPPPEYDGQFDEPNCALHGRSFHVTQWDIFLGEGWSAPIRGENWSELFACLMERSSRGGERRVVANEHFVRPEEEGCAREGEVDARVVAPTHCSCSWRLRRWEDVVMDVYGCNYEDHTVNRRDESDITAVDFAVLHHELAVDPLRWFADFAMKKKWH